jgi:nucleotide-binding universal stress UspA family protein
MTYKRIFVPVDGSPTSNLGLKEAIRLAKSQRAQLQLVHVLDQRHLAAPVPEFGSYLENVLPELKKSGRRILDKAQAAVQKHGLKSTTVLIETFTAPAATPLVRQARKWRADLLVIGTHGRRGVSRLLLGSDAEQILRNSPVPVLLVRAKGE